MIIARDVMAGRRMIDLTIDDALVYNDAIASKQFVVSIGDRL